jgi:hypothetical protein
MAAVGIAVEDVAEDAVDGEACGLVGGTRAVGHRDTLYYPVLEASADHERAGVKL